MVKIEDTVLQQIESMRSRVLKRLPKKVWPCKPCGIVFRYKRDFRVHCDATHNDTPIKYTCRLCNMEFPSFKDVDEHLKIHEETKFICSPCGQFFNTGFDYSLHLYEHDSTKGYPCPICNYTTPKQSGINPHINMVHLFRFDFICRQCGMRFGNKSNLLEHEEIHADSSAKFVCVVCSKTFSENDTLTIHQFHYHKVTVKPEHTKLCNICGKSYPTRSSLKLHLTNCHTEEGAVDRTDTKKACSVCGKYFTQVKTHMKTHANYKPYKCSYCEKSFLRKSGLIKHKIIHSAERPYDCKICEKRFNLKSTLDSHMRIHTGEKPFKCHLCNRAFVIKSRLNYHLKSCK